MQEKGKKRKIPVFDSVWKQRIGLYGGLLLIVVIAAAIPGIYNDRKSVELAVPPENITYSGPSYLYSVQTAPERSATFPLMYALGDKRWSGERIGHTGYTIGEAGSLACALAYDQPEERLPSQINQAMSELGAYTDTGGVLWDIANECTAPMRYQEHRNFDPMLAYESLRDGKSVMVLVAGENNMALWLWLAATEDGQYLVYNPQNANGLTENLAAHGRVYALLVGEMAG